MSCVKQKKGGYKIRLEKGKLLPKVYPSLKACQARVQQLKRFRK